LSVGWGGARWVAWAGGCGKGWTRCGVLWGGVARVVVTVLGLEFCGGWRGHE